MRGGGIGGGGAAANPHDAGLSLAKNFSAWISEAFEGASTGYGGTV